MRFVTKQILGILIFANVVFFTRPGSMAEFMEKLDLRVLSSTQKIVWLTILVVWMVLWNTILGLFKKKKSVRYGTVRTRSAYVPPKMKVVSGAVLRVEPTAQPTPVSPNPNPAQPNPSTDPQLEEDLVALTNGFWGDLDIGAFTHVVYGGEHIELVYSSNERALIIKILNKDGLWIVDPSTGNFVNGTTVLPSPVAMLHHQQEILKTIESSAQIFCVLLLMRGTIQKEEDVQNYLNQHNVTLAKFNDDVSSNAKTILQLLLDNFSKSISPVASELGWDELSEQEEQEMLRKKQEVNYDQENEKDSEEQ